MIGLVITTTEPLTWRRGDSLFDTLEQAIRAGTARIDADPCPFPRLRLFRWSRRRAT